MDTPPIPQPAPMPIFILFDTQTGYLYGHLFATGPEDPFLQEVIDWFRAVILFVTVQPSTIAETRSDIVCRHCNY